MRRNLLIGAAAVVGLLLIGSEWYLLARPTPNVRPLIVAQVRTAPTSNQSPTQSFTTANPAATTTPTVATPNVSPSLITVSTPTTVTVTVQISPTPIAGGVNLLELGATGTQPTILGVMHDDGLNGDTVPNDGVYTLQMNFNDVSAGQIQLEVSAAFPGVLARKLSPAVSLAVWAALSDQTDGFSLMYPPALYETAASAAPGQYVIASSPLGVDLGGGSPPNSSETDSSGYVISITSVAYAAPFKIAQYLADIHPDDPIGTITPITVANVSAYTVIFTDEVGAGEPITIIPRNGSILELSYGSTFPLGSPQDQAGLTAYEAVIGTLKLQ